MKNEIEPEPANTEAISSKPEQVTEYDDEIEFKGVKLGRRQQSANEEIVCEGGCE